MNDERLGNLIGLFIVMIVLCFFGLLQFIAGKLALAVVVWFFGGLFLLVLLINYSTSGEGEE